MVLVLSAILNSVYGYISLFILSMVSSVVPFPGTSVLVASYASLEAGLGGLIFLWLFVALAGFIGDFLVYLVSRRFSDKIQNFLKRYNWYNKNEKKARSYLNRHEFSFVFLSRFLLTGVDQVISYISGFEKLNIWKFAAAAFLGELVYSAIYVSAGFIFKDAWAEVISFVQYFLAAIVFAAIAVYVLYRIIKFYKNKDRAK